MFWREFGYCRGPLLGFINLLIYSPPFYCFQQMEFGSFPVSTFLGIKMYFHIPQKCECTFLPLMRGSLLNGMYIFILFFRCFTIQLTLIIALKKGSKSTIYIQINFPILISITFRLHLFRPKRFLFFIF